MKINPSVKVREVAGEHIVIKKGVQASDMMHVVALNTTSMALYEAFRDNEFELDDIVTFLVERYDVSGDTARADAQNWINEMQKQGLII